MRAHFADDFTDIQRVEANHSSSDEEEELSDSSEDFELPEPTTFASLRNNITTSKFSKYLKDFDEVSKAQSVTFASLPAHVIDQGNRAQLLAVGLEREDEHLQHQNDLDHIELLKKRRMFELQRKRIEEINNNRRQVRDIQIKGTLTGELLGTFFDHSKQSLDIHLTTRTAEVLQSIGEIRRFERGDYDPNKPDWSLFEQQVEMNIIRIRGLKDKVPRGEYMMLVSKWDKLGGEPMRWNNRTKFAMSFAPCALHSEEKDETIRGNCEVCQGWCGSTAPMSHSGDQRAYEQKVETKVFTFFPSQQSIKPYMILMFELVQLPVKRKGTPKIVGWGAMPCIDSNFAVINGKFRFPLLRGEYKPKFTHFESIMEEISHDIENWLANVYIEVFPHPREHFGRQEFQLHQEFTSHLLCLDDYPSAKDGEGWPVDLKKRGLSFDLENEAALKELAANEKANATADGGERMVKSAAMRNGVIDDTNYFPYLRPQVVRTLETPVQTWWGLIRDSVLDRQRSKRQEEQRAQREAVKRAEEQKQYRFSIHPHGAILMESAWSTQVEYCTRAILDELSLRDPTSYKFWLNVAVIFASLIFQNFMRGCFVFLGCFAVGVPIDYIDMQFFGLMTHFSVNNTTALQEVMFCFFNLAATFLLLQSLITFGTIFRKVSGRIPEQLSKFVFAMAWSFYFVPFLDLLIDFSQDIYHGDLVRLVKYFVYHNYGMLFGLITFFVIYFFFCAIVFVVTFLFTMRLHLNGILQDAYWRILVVNEDNFFIPSDLEVSQREFYHILSRAERWRGMTGKRRKVAVYDLITTDPAYPKFLQKNQYIAVYELNTEDTEQYLELKPMKVYRHFFFTYEGAILESLPDEMPTGVVAAVLKMQTTLLKALSKGKGDPMSLGLKSELKHVELPPDSVTNKFGSAAPRQKKTTVSFQPSGAFEEL